MHSVAFSDNLKSVRPETVELVMSHFFDQHPILDQNINLLTLNSTKIIWSVFSVKRL